MRIRVATYNVHKGVGLDRARRPDRILSVLNELGADIVALQEIDRRFGARAAIFSPDMLAAHTDFVAVPLNARDDSLGWHGNAIIVRRGTEIGEHCRIDLPTIEPRGAVMAEVALNGTPVRIVAMHLDLSGLRRSFQARTILQRCAELKPMATVLMGDLNEWSPRHGCLRDFGRTMRIAATPPSFHSRRPVARLDRIMTDLRTHIVGCGVHHSPNSRVASDHLPVWADIEIANA
jgi:endonuclease/exonuclease/phosphatase family metal-dependent hydrolase